MSQIEFPRNDYISLGAEIEIQLIDPTTGDLKPAALEILDQLKKNPDAKFIKSEIFQSMLEIESAISQNAYQIGSSFRKSLAIVRSAARNLGAHVMMGGTHPFALYSERRLTPKSRYFDLVDRNQWITRRLQVFGLHVHLGMRDGEHAISMNNALCHYLPVILAISGSSPFWRNEDTGLASSRITFFEAMPTGGHPYSFNSWTEFENLIERLIYSKSISSIKDLWWDIRPNVEYGTLEIRIADCPPTIKEVEALVALIHCLAVHLDKELSWGQKFQSPPEWILRENKWRAARHGVQCELITDENGTSIPFLDVWKKLCKSLRPIERYYGYEPLLNFLDTVIAKGPSYSRQRAHRKNGLDAVIQNLVREGEKDLPDWNIKDVPTNAI